MPLDPVRRAVLTDMAYEIGGQGLAGFVNFLAAIRTGAWFTASIQLTNSKLYQQVPQREERNLDALTSGQFPLGVTCVEDLIRKNEGCVLVARPDAKGKWEIGYGHDIQAQGPTPLTCTQAEANTWFATDLEFALARAEIDLGREYW